MIKAVVFDLDDTLFAEKDYVKSGYGAVAKYIREAYGIEGACDELMSIFEENRLHVFDTYLERHGLPSDEKSVGLLVEVYRSHDPVLSLSEGTRRALVELRSAGYKLGIITDGRPGGQRAKIAALGLDKLVDEIIMTDELGVQYRKPNRKAFDMTAQRFGISLGEMMYVGDNPCKDFVIGGCGVKTVRVMSGGMYADCRYADGVLPDATAKSIDEIIEIARRL